MNISYSFLREKFDLWVITLFLFSCNVALMAPLFFYGFNIFLVLILSLLMFFVNNKIDKKTINLIAFFFFLFFPLLIIQSTYLFYADAIWQQGLFTIFVTIIVLLICNYINLVKISIIIKALNISILVFSIPIILQFFYVYVLGGDPFKVDIASFFGGIYSRSGNTNTATVDFIYTYRPTGFTSEPSTSSGVISSFMILNYLICKDKYKFVLILGIVGMILSMSTLGTILAILLSVLFFVNSLKKMLVVFFVGSISSGFLLLQLGARYERFISGDDGSNNVKKEVIHYFLSDPFITLFGYSNPIISSFNSPQYFQALGDLGFFLTIIGRYGLLVGLIFLFFFIIWLISIKFSMKEYFLIILALLKFSTCLSPAFIIFCLILNRIKTEREYK